MSLEVIEFLKVSLLIMGNIIGFSILVSAVIVIGVLRQIHKKVEKTKILAEDTFYNLSNTGANFFSLAQSLFGNKKNIKSFWDRFFG